jgi:hypothetical protein
MPISPNSTTSKNLLKVSDAVLSKTLTFGIFSFHLYDQYARVYLNDNFLSTPVPLTLNENLLQRVSMLPFSR